jgi:hypothetical protein
MEHSMTNNPMMVIEMADKNGMDEEVYGAIRPSPSVLNAAIKTVLEKEDKSKYDIYYHLANEAEGIKTETVFIGVDSMIGINFLSSSSLQTVTVKEKFLAKNSEADTLRTVRLRNLLLRQLRTPKEIAELQSRIKDGNKITERKHIFTIESRVFTLLSNNVLWRTGTKYFDGQGVLAAMNDGDYNKILERRIGSKKIWETKFTDSANHVFDVEFEDVVQQSVNDQIKGVERTLFQPLAIFGAQGFLFVAVLVENWGNVVAFEAGLSVLLPTCLVLAFLITEQCVSCFAVGAGRNTKSFFIIFSPYFLFASLPYIFVCDKDDDKRYTVLRLWIEIATAIMLLLSTIVVVNSQARVLDILFNVGGLVLVSQIDDIFSNGKLGHHLILKLPVMESKDIPTPKEPWTPDDYDENTEKTRADGKLNEYLLFYRFLSVIIFLMLMLPRYTNWVF